MMLRHTLLFACGLHFFLTSAQDGTPDPTFGTNGVTIADAGKSDILRDITLQNDGRIVAAGWAYDDTRTDLLVARFTEAGVLDPTFGEAGVVILPTGPAHSGAEAVDVLPDGKVLVAGYSNNGSTNGFTVWRFNADGTLDNGFGTGGVFTDFSFTEGSYVNDMDVQADGRIVITGPGFVGNGTATVERLTANGTLDATFNGTGRMRWPADTPSATQWTPSALEVLPDGRIIVVGSNQVNGDWNAFILRVGAAGQLDPAFNGTGVRTMDSDRPCYAYNLTVRPDGRYVMTGEMLFSTSYDVLFIQVDASGANSNFGGTNFWSINNGAHEYCRGAAVQADGKVLVAGSSSPFSGANGFLMRTVADGEGSDPGFGTSGWVSVDFGDYTYVEDMVVQPDGKAIIAGNSASGGAPYDMMLARYIVDGTADVSGMDADDALSLFPLPNDGSFTVTGTHSGDRLVVHDAHGAVVRTQRADEGTTILHTGLPPGPYAVRVSSATAQRTLRCIIR